jgi:hypothetical protein
MVSTGADWINKSAISSLTALQGKYTKIAQETTITAAACTAGEKIFLRRMQLMILGQPATIAYSDVAQAISVFSGDDDVYVGLPEGHALVPRAQQMEEIFPICQTVLDLDKQSGDSNCCFEEELAKAGGFTE